MSWGDFRTSVGFVMVLAGVFAIPVDTALAQDDSTLHKFEKSIKPASGNNKEGDSQQEPTHQSEEHGDEIGNELGDDLETSIFQGIMDLTVDVVADGGRSSLQRVASDKGDPLRRDDGEALIPFVSYDFGYQQVSSNIAAKFNRIEGGYGPVALYLEDYSFHETAPVSALKVQRQMLLYRMAGKSLEVDIGLGQSVVTGMQRTVITTSTVRGKLMLSDSVSIDFLPVWGNGMDDYELSLHWGRQFGSLAVGYRSLQTAGASLNGPFAGLSLYF